MILLRSFTYFNLLEGNLSAHHPHIIYGIGILRSIIIPSLPFLFV